MNSLLARFARSPSTARRLVFGASFAALGCSPLLNAKDFTFEDGTPPAKRESPDSGGVAPDAARERTLANVAGAVRIGAPEPESLFGDSVAISGDTLAASAPFANSANANGVVPNGGAVYVYDLAAPVGSSPEVIHLPDADQYDAVLPANLVSDNVQPAPFPWGVMPLAMNEQSLVVGVPAEASARRDDARDNSAPYAGAVYVYDRTKPGTRPQYLKASNIGAGDTFGCSVSLSKSFLAIGAPREASGDVKNQADDSAPISGAVYVYSRDVSGAFVNPIYVKAPEISANAGFGFSVAVSDDHLVVGSPTQSTVDENGIELSGAGEVHVFRRTTTGWEIERSLWATHPQASGFFGFSVSPFTGGYFVVGATGEKDCEPSGGAATTGRGDAYLVSRTGGEWAQACLVPESGIEQVIFGFSVVNDGSRYVVGAPYDSSAVIDDPSDQSMGAAGAAYLFPRDAQDQKQYVKAPQPRPSGFGFSLALGGSRLVVGAAYERHPMADSAGTLQKSSTLPPEGAVYVFGLD